MLTKKKPPGSANALIDFIVNHFDRERNLRIGVANEVLADPVYVLGDDRIVDNPGLALDFLRHLFADADLFFYGVEVYFAGDIAIADFIGIVFLIRRERREPQ